MSQTLLDMIWGRHVVAERDDGTALLYVDRHLMHEGSRSAFAMLATTKREVARPRLSFAFADHLVPTVGQALGIDHIANDEARTMARTQVANCGGAGIELFGMDHPGQGIVHVAGPEQGLTLPGLLIVCGDSHTSTHGAFGALAFGIGASEVAHVLATQTLWQRRPRNLLVQVDGELQAGVFAKDLALALIARIGAVGATGHVIEFAGETIAALSMEARMTLCNMSIEAGARAGLISPDEKTFAYLRGRPYAPEGEAWRGAERGWRQLASAPGAVFDAEVALDAREVAPMTTWGTSPEDAVPLRGVVPAPEDIGPGGQRERRQRALDYMGLRAGQAIRDVEVDHVFIGSCTNSRIEDLRLVARLVEGRRAAVPTMVVPGSRQVRAQAEAEGLDQVFRAAGLDWRDPGCSMCLGMNGDVLSSGQRCASTSNRNFEGRQGKGVRTHLVSPATAAATAVFGRLTDPREIDPAGGAR